MNQIEKDLIKLENPEKIKRFARFFKTGKGEYGEGDIFLGISVPEQRKIAKKYQKFELKDVQKMLSSKIHEHRSVALMILIIRYNKSNTIKKKKIFDFYLKNMKYVNNWDLVDGSARFIIGNYLLDKDRTILYKLAASKNLWKRRIAIISTYEFIRHSQFYDTLKISEMFLNDKHDLIHKAVGWMLRELGKKNQKLLEQFLKKHRKKMPRTMLRYATEKLSKEKRKYYMRM